MQQESVRPQLENGSIEEATWNPTGETLTLRTQLDFATVTDPTEIVERPVCTLLIDRSATDLTGTPLNAPFQLRFTPALRVVHRSDLLISLRGHAHGTYILAGDGSDDTREMGLVPFDISGVSTDLLEVSEATLTLALRQRGTTTPMAGAPFDTLGELWLDHAHYEARSVAAYAEDAWLGDVTRLFASSLPALDEAFDIDVTDAVRDDIEHRIARKNLAEFRLRFEFPTDGDGAADQVMFWNYPAKHSSCDGDCLPHQVPHLVITYFAP